MILVDQGAISQLLYVIISKIIVTFAVLSGIYVTYTFLHIVIYFLYSHICSDNREIPSAPGKF